jgi:hypothetical protein
MDILILLIILNFIASITLGWVLISRPLQVIEFQKRLYYKINWRMEPVNMDLEVRNTRIMGFMIMGVVITVILYTMFLTGGKFRL